MGASFIVIGGDKRLEYLADELRGDGHTVFYERLRGSLVELNVLAKAATYAVLPYPAESSGFLNGTEAEIGEVLDALKYCRAVFAGSVSQKMIKFADENNINIVDYALSPQLLLANASITAEAAVNLAMELSDISILGSRCLVVGCGRIGKSLCSKLKALGAIVCAVARSAAGRQSAELCGCEAAPMDRLSHQISFADFVFNTVPSLVLDRQVLSYARPDAVVIDLASSPGGTDFDAAREFCIKAVHALALPGKYAPKSAAVAIRDAIYNSMDEEVLLINGKT